MIQEIGVDGVGFVVLALHHRGAGLEPGFLLKDWDGDISRLSDEQLEKFLVESDKRAKLQAQQRAALPPASEAVIEATAEEITTAD